MRSRVKILLNRNLLTRLSRTIENPYQSPSEPDAETATSVSVIETPQTLVGELKLGARVAVKWVTIIVAPILVLTFLGVLGFFVYRGAVDGDWSRILEPEILQTLGLFLAILCVAYSVCCFWASLFAVIVFGGRYLNSRRS